MDEQVKRLVELYREMTPEQKAKFLQEIGFLRRDIIIEKKDIRYLGPTLGSKCPVCGK